VIVVHPLGTSRRPANGCLVETPDGGMCPHVASYAVMVRATVGPVRSMVCGVHRLGLRDEGRLAGAAPIAGGRS
jgi:hypothetical protein